MAERTDLSGLTLELDHKYAVGHVLHRGPIATTYLATWTLFNLPVYVRFYESLSTLRLRHRDATRIRWTIESETGKIRGEHLPDIVDSGMHGPTQPFLVLRLPKGELLSEKLEREGRLPAQETARIVHAIASALQDYREQGNPHRGPTVDRVWLGESGEVLLLGYGEVLYREETLMMQGVATTELLWHIPPESFLASQPLVDEANTGARSSTLRLRARGAGVTTDRNLEDAPRAEAYALACLGYHCINGHHPFFAVRSDPSEGIQTTLVGEALPLHGHGPKTPVASAIARGLVRQPEERWESAYGFAAALNTATGRTQELAEAHQGDESLVPSDVDEHDDVLDLAPRNTTELWLWRIAAVVLAGALGVTLMRDRGAESAVLITSDPPGLQIGQEIGHVTETLGATPITLLREDGNTPLRLFAIGPDGQRGETALLVPGNAPLVDDCRFLNLTLEFSNTDDNVPTAEAMGTPAATDGSGSTE
ncbi:MAG: serine/threonine protein kinase [Bradymonadia bacterium]|jgi:serine/threonine protein kinase